MRAVRSGSLTVTGLPSLSGTLASTFAPCAALTWVATFFRSAKIFCRMPSSKVRMVPTTSTSSGMML